MLIRCGLFIQGWLRLKKDIYITKLGLYLVLREPIFVFTIPWVIWVLSSWLLYKRRFIEKKRFFFLFNFSFQKKLINKFSVDFLEKKSDSILLPEFKIIDLIIFDIIGKTKEPIQADFDYFGYLVYRFLYVKTNYKTYVKSFKPLRIYLLSYFS